MDETQLMIFELGEESIRLITAALKGHLDRWAGGDPDEQEQIRQLYLGFYAAQLELNWDD